MIDKTLRLIFAFATATGVAHAAPPAPPAPIEIISAEFGIFHDGKPNELVFEPTNIVPRKNGQRYGWIIEVRTTRRTLAVREEYLLPKQKPVKEATDPVSKNLLAPTPRLSQVSQRQLVPVDGQIFGEWATGPDEPAGHRHLQVVVEGQVAGSFEFDVK